MRREYNLISSGVLPAGYAECEYIESTGTQYINTMLPATASLYCYVEFALSSIPSAATHTVFAARKNNAGAYGFGVRTSGGKNGFQINCTENNAPTSLDDIAMPDFNWHKVEFNKNVNEVKFDENEIDISALNFSFANTMPYSIYLFAFNGDGILYQRANTKIKVAIYSNERHLIPSLRLSDGKPGLYDICGSICPLTNTPFYVNAGSGEFLYQLKN